MTAMAMMARPALAQERTAVTAAEAGTIVTSLYAALAATSPDTIERLLGASTTPDWQDCGATDACEDRSAAIKHWAGRFAVVPDSRWEQKELLVSGNRIIVRGQETGTPVLPFLGVAPTGRSFSVMTIDIHEVREGRVARTYHVEDWGSAIRQLSQQ